MVRYPPLTMYYIVKGGYANRIHHQWQIMEENDG